MISLMYPATSFVCGTIVLIIAIRALLAKGTASDKGRTFLFLVLWVCLFCYSDAIWGIVGSGYVLNSELLFVTSTIFHLFASFTALFWTRFLEVYFKVSDKIKYVCNFSLTILISAAIALLVFNYKTEFCFHVDENSIYVPGNGRNYIFALQFIAYVCIALYSIVRLIISKKDRINNLSIMAFVASPIVFGIVQLLNHDLPSYSMGFALGCIVIDSFLLGDSNKEKIAINEELNIQENYLEIMKDISGFANWNAYVTHDGDIKYETSETNIGTYLGYDTDVVNGVWTKFIHSEDYERVIKAHIDSVANDLFPGKYSVEYRCKDAEGRYRWLRELGRTFYTNDGNEKKICGIFFDVTAEHDELEFKKIIEKNDRLIDTLSSEYTSVIEVCVSQNKFRICKSGGKLAEYFGATDEYISIPLIEFYGRYIEVGILNSQREMMRDFFSPDTFIKNLEGVDYFSKIYLNEKNEYMEIKVVKINGSSDNLVIGFSSKDAEIRRDMEKKYEIDVLLKKQQTELSELRSALVMSADGYYEVNLSKDMLIGDIINFDSEGKPFSVVIPDLDNTNKCYSIYKKWVADNLVISDKEEYICQTLPATLIAKFDSGTPVVEIYSTVGLNNGETKDSRQTCYMYKDSFSGDVIALCLIVDITENIRIQKELAEAKKEAEEASEAKTRFLFNMSHDIRTPMNAITGYTAMAQKHIDEKERVTDCLSKIDTSSHHLLELINAVLDMSRVETGNVMIEEKPVNIIEKAEGVMDIVREIASSKNIGLSMEIQNVQNADVYADELHVNQIMTNIISNAVKYTPSGGTVKYIVRQEGPVEHGIINASLIIADNGIGMSKEFLTHIFDSFSRERNSTTSGVEGTGLGMSIVKKLVDLLDGTIEIESELGKGTTVCVSLPFKVQKIKETRIVEITESKNVCLDGKRVLLVEDNEMNREIASEILEEEGLVVETAEDGDVAVDIVRKSAAGYFNFVLMDVQMPRMNGYDATREIRKIDNPEIASIPIIAMTANAFEEDRKNAIDAGMNDHLAKPIDVKKLIETLSKYCHKD